jgi:hypothetical protein
MYSATSTAAACGARVKEQGGHAQAAPVVTHRADVTYIRAVAVVVVIVVIQSAAVT